MEPLTFTKHTLQQTAPDEFGIKAKRFRSAIHCVKLSKDGNYAALGTSSKLLCLYNPYRGHLLQTYMAHGLDVTSVDCSDDNANLLSASKDFSCIYWDVETGKTLKRFRDHLGAVNQCIFPNETSTLAVTGSMDTFVRVFDCESRNQGKPVQEMSQATDSVTSLDSKRHFIASGSADGILRIYDIRQGQLNSYDLAGGVISGICLSRDCQSALVNIQSESQSSVEGSHSNSKIVLVDLLGSDDKKPVRFLQNIENSESSTGSISDLTNSMYPIEVSFNGKTENQIITGSDNGNLYRFDLLNPYKHNKIKLSDNPIISISHHPTINGRIVCASAEAYYVLNEKNDIDEHLHKEADLRVEGQTVNKKRCLEREYLPGAYLGGQFR